MKKIFLLVVMIIFIIVGCKTNYTIENKNGHRIIKNRIENPEIKKINKIKSYSPDNLYLFYPNFNNDLIVSFYADKKQKRYIGVFDLKLNLKHKMKIIRGKGPGEILTGAVIDYKDDKIYVADLRKKTLEVYNKNLDYFDTIKMNNVVSAMYRNPSEIDINSQGIYFSPTIPYSLIKIDYDGKLKAKVKSKKNVEDHPHRIWGWNYCLLDMDNKNIFVTYPSRIKSYKIRKYDSDLNLIWENRIDDEFEDILKKDYIRKADGTTQPRGAYKANDIKACNGKIYVLRGVGGGQVWNKNHTDYKNKKIEKIDYGFIDVFKQKNGKFLYRIETDFLNTKMNYRFDVKGNKFYFYSNVYYLDEDSIDPESNLLTVAELKT